jgi:peroxiredoxin
MKQPMEIPPRRPFDATSAAMVTVTLAAILGTAWLRDGRSNGARPAVVGDLAPALHLLDLETGEPLVLAGTRGKVVWVSFWSAGSPKCESSLKELDQASRPLRVHGRFASVLAAVDSDQPARVRAAVSASGVDLPVYLASAESRRLFGALDASSPVHVLIDADGRVIAIARGAGAQTFKRIADQAKRQLDELDPLGKTRFAGVHARGFRMESPGRGCIVLPRFLELPPGRTGDQDAGSSSSRIRAATS